MAAQLPPLVPFPPIEALKSLPGPEWTSLLEAWEVLLENCLRTSLQDLADSPKQYQSLIAFLVSYAQAVADSRASAHILQAGQKLPLRRSAFLSAHRLLEQASAPEQLLDWRFLGDFSQIYHGSPGLASLLASCWTRHSSKIEAQLRPLTESLAQSLDSGKSSVIAQSDFSHRLLPLAHALAPIATFCIAGSDLMDGLLAGYAKLSGGAQRKIVILVFLGLASLIRGEKPNASMLFDHMFTLKTSVPPDTRRPSHGKYFLADLLTETPLLGLMRTHLLDSPHSTRARTLITALEPLQSTSTRAKHTTRRKTNQATWTESATTYGHDTDPNPSVTDMALISQIRDLFPDLGTTFISALLSHYSNSVEQATAALLDESLPLSISSLDRTADLPPAELSRPKAVTPTHQTPPSAPLAERRNKYDNDAFDRLAVSRSQVRTSKPATTADTLLTNPDDRTSSKAAILSALAAIDMDDDERDDTYDAEDVGGTVDTDDRDVVTEDVNEEALFRAWTMDASIFAREARRSKGRDSLKSETGLTDEALEGWAMMMVRDPRRRRRLEGLYSLGGSGPIQQNNLDRTRWSVEQDEERSDVDGRAGGRGGFRGRGGGVNRGRGNVAGPTGERDTQVARQRKDQHKGSRANHNRRDGRARKMARAGGMSTA